jgi:hypothetical protein
MFIFGAQKSVHKDQRLDIAYSHIVTFLSQACNTVWGWGKPTVTLLLGEGERMAGVTSCNYLHSHT